MNSDEGIAETWTEAGAAGRERLGAASNLEHARLPRVGGQQIIDDDCRPAALLHVAVLLGRVDVLTTDVDRAEVGVVPERCRDDMRLVIGASRGKSPETLAGEIVDLGWSEFGHSPSTHHVVDFRSRLTTEPVTLGLTASGCRISKITSKNAAERTGKTTSARLRQLHRATAGA